jgi:hypothetical protein
MSGQELAGLAQWHRAHLCSATTIKNSSRLRGLGAIYVIIAVAAAIEHQRHENAANYEGENDAEDHGYVAMDAHLHVNTVPSINSPPDREAQKGDEEKKNQGAFHGISRS